MNAPAPARATRRVVLDAGLALLGLGLAAWCAYSVLSHPLTGMRAPAYALLWLFGVLGCNRAFALAQGGAGPGALRTALRVGKWVLPWFLPIGAIAAIEPAVLARQTEAVRRALVPVIAYADAHPPGAFSAEAAPAIAFPLPVRFASTERGYLLWLQAASIDIDGNLHVYDSTTRRWARTPYDSQDAVPLPEAHCTLERRAWHCIEDETVGF